jgi:hypothetical protein
MFYRRESAQYRWVAMVALASLALALLVGKSNPAISFPATMIFFTLNGGLLFDRARRTPKSSKKMMLIVQGACTLAIPLMFGGFMIMFGIDLSH